MGNWLADMQGWLPEMQKGGPRCKNHSCFHAFGQHAKRWADMRGWPPEMQKMFLHRGQPLLDVAHVGPAILLFYCFAILLLYYSLHVQYCRGRCLGLAARDAKSLFASRTATLRCRPRTTTYNHILPRTTAERSFCISDSHPCALGPPILLFYYFSILPFYVFTVVLFDSTYSTAAPMFGVRCPRCKKVLHRGQPLLDDGLILLTTTYYHLLYHILPRTTTYYHVLPRTTTYYLVLPRTTTYYHVLHVLQQNVVFASRAATLARRPSYSTVLRVYYFTILLCHSTHNAAAADVWGWRPEMQKAFLHRGQPLLDVGFVLPRTTTYYHGLPRITTYYHVRPRTTAKKVFASRAATLACRPSHSTVLQNNFHILLFHSTYSTAAADVWGWQPGMQNIFCIAGSRS